MIRIPMAHARMLGGIFATCLLALRVPAAGEWSVSAGPMFHGGMKLSAGGSSYVQQNGLHGMTAYRSVPKDAGAAGGYANRTYDDGTVNTEAGTAEPATLVPGLTWNWSYQDAGQYDAAHDRLSFHSRGSAVSVAPDRNGAFDDEEDLVAYGFEIMASRFVTELKKVDLSLDFGVQAQWAEDQSMESSLYAEDITQSRVLVTDTYDTSGAGIPSAPYSGNYTGPGPVIPNTPDARTTRTTATGRMTAANNVRLDVEPMIASLVLGPRFTLRLGEGKGTVFVVPMISCTMVDVQVDRDETFTLTRADGTTSTLNRWSDSEDEQAFRFGAGIFAGADWPLGDGWSIGAKAGYQGVFEDVDVEVGPNWVSVDPNGYSVMITVGKQL